MIRRKYLALGLVLALAGASAVWADHDEGRLSKRVIQVLGFTSRTDSGDNVSSGRVRFYQAQVGKARRMFRDVCELNALSARFKMETDDPEDELLFEAAIVQLELGPDGDVLCEMQLQDVEVGKTVQAKWRTIVAEHVEMDDKKCDGRVGLIELVGSCNQELTSAGLGAGTPWVILVDGSAEVKGTLEQTYGPGRRGERSPPKPLSDEDDD